ARGRGEPFRVPADTFLVQPGCQRFGRGVYDIKLWVDISGEQVAVKAAYSTAVFYHRTVARLLDAIAAEASALVEPHRSAAPSSISRYAGDDIAAAVHLANPATVAGGLHPPPPTPTLRPPARA